MSELLATSRDPLIGAHVDARYLVESVIGRGGMGVVYAAVHEELQRPVAIKVLNPAWASDQDAAARFLREARVASSLSHANIVDVWDLGRLPDGRPYLVMPRITGEDLGTLLAEEGPLHPQRVVKLLEGVAAALDLIHDKGFVHRDIKPENLLHVVREDGSEAVLVLDFGIAAAILTESRLTKDGVLCGTPDFLPPEVLSGALPDRRGDVYALATVAFELMTGRLPFLGANPFQLLSLKLAQAAPTLTSASGRGFPPAIEQVIARGLAQRPEDRYATAGEFIHALKSAAEQAHGEIPDLSTADTQRHLARKSAFIRRKERADDDDDGPAPAAPLDVAARADGGARGASSDEAAPAPSDVAAPAPAGAAVGEASRASEPVRKRAPRASHAPPVLIVDEEDVDIDALMPTLRRPRVMQNALVVLALAIMAVGMIWALRDGDSTPAPIAGAGPPAAAPETPAPAATSQAVAPAAPALPPAGTAAGSQLTGARSVERASSSRSQRRRADRRPAEPSAATVEPQLASDDGTSPALRGDTMSTPAPAMAVAPVPAAEGDTVLSIAPSAPAPLAMPAPAAPELPAQVAPALPASEPVSVSPAPPVAPEPVEPPRDRERARELTDQATTAMLQGQLSSALALYRNASQADRSYAAAWRGRGLALQELGRPREAAQAFREFLRIEPRGPQSEMIRSRLQSLESANGL